MCVLSLLQNLTQTSINMYDPLPPTDSTCGYSRPERYIYMLAMQVFEKFNSLYRSMTESQSEEYENPLLLLLRSLLPHYNPTVTFW